MTTTTPAAEQATEKQAAPAEPSKALAPATPPPPAARIQVQFDPSDPVSLYMDTGIFEQLQRVARMMASSSLVPQHLRSIPKRGDEPAVDRTADCFLVAAQAFRWRMDCFAVAQHTFVTSGKLGYEGKLIAALINASGRTEQNLEPVYDGAEGTPQRKVEIVARLKGEGKDRKVTGTVAGWATNNEKWKSMPDQMLFYRGAREWARRHMPEVMLGISAEEEIGETVTLARNPAGTYEARPSGLDALTARLESERPAETSLAAAVTEATAETPAASQVQTSASPDTPAERVPGEDDDTPAPAAGQVAQPATAQVVATAPPAPPEPDPRTPEGNPFLRKQQEAAKKAAPAKPSGQTRLQE